MNTSAQRMCMPEIPEDIFMDALHQLVDLEKDWIPAKEGSSLYLRPFMFGTDEFIGVHSSASYKFIIMALPVGPYYSKPVSLKVEETYLRAAVGGVGEAKTAGNYAASLYPAEVAKKEGYDNVMWMDEKEFKYVQEVGTMNIFFKIDGKFITPVLDGSVLHGITRSSVIAILKHKGYEVTERLITIDEIAGAAQNGTLEEAFGTGTAVGIAYIQEIGMDGETITVSHESPVGLEVNNMLNDIKTGGEDPFNWMIAIPNSETVVS